VGPRIKEWPYYHKAAFPELQTEYIVLNRD